MGHKILQCYSYSKIDSFFHISLVHLHQFLGLLNWAQPYIPLTTDMLSSFFQMLKKQHNPTSFLQLTPALPTALWCVTEKLSTVLIDRVPTLNVPLSLIIFTGKAYAFTAVVTIYNQSLSIIVWLYSSQFSGTNVLPYADMYAQLISDSRNCILSLTSVSYI